MLPTDLIPKHQHKFHMNYVTFKCRITIIVLTVFTFLCFVSSAEPKSFKVASYNVENLFDLHTSGTEYPEYIPYTGYGWTRDIAAVKFTHIARVIKDLGCDVVALQEIESQKALMTLQKRLKAFGVNYPYVEIADFRDTVIKCAVLSKFPILMKEEILPDNSAARSILKVTLDIDGYQFIVFINHWKSKRGPESMRIEDAKALRKEIDKLQKNVDFILIGDFNSNYNEYQTIRNSDRLNDTRGITGINHILKTIKGTDLVNEKILTKQPKDDYLYNLWLEVSNSRRWSYNFFGKKETPDNIIVSKGLYDNKGISYIDNSFNKFQADYLFKENAVYRWQRARSGKGRHLGEGYSDHLPISAYFSTEPFQFKTNDGVFDDVDTVKSEKVEYLPCLLDLNNDNREKLMTVKGIGPVLSARIIGGRPYKKVDELIRVKGIGPKRLEKFRPYFYIGTNNP